VAVGVPAGATTAKHRTGATAWDSPPSAVVGRRAILAVRSVPADRERAQFSGLDLRQAEVIGRLPIWTSPATAAVSIAPFRAIGHIAGV